MTEEERLALSRVQLNLAVSDDDVWSPLEHHVSELHANVAREVLARFDVAERGREKPIGVVLEGDKGVGKTHMLRWVRQEVQSRGGFFFLVKFLEGGEFWHGVLHSVVQGFFRGQSDQLTPILRSLCELAGMDSERRQRLCGTIPVARSDLDAFVDGLFEVNRQVAIECEDTARALVLYRSRGAAGDAGRTYFDLDGDLEPDQRAAWGLRRGARLPQEIFRDLSRLIALAGPSVLAVDQLDSLMVQSGPADDVPMSLVNQVADGLMEMRELTRRTLTVVACLPATWQLISTRAAASAADRFSRVQMKGSLPGAEIAEQLVGMHLASRYVEIGFTQRYPTWPVLPSAFESARHHTPRRLLAKVGDHVRMCLESGQVVELSSFDEDATPPIPPRPAADGELAALDETLEELRAAADVTAPVSAGTEDEVMPRILAAGLKAYLLELGGRAQGLELDPPPGAKPALHARLRLNLDERTEDQVHWSFRAIAATHPNAVLSRLRSARTEAGLAGVDKRKLWLLRNIQMSAGKVTTRTVAEFEEAGGLSSTISDADIRTFSALEVMLDKHDPALLPWLVSRRPAGSTELFRKVFGEGPDTWRSSGPVPDPGPTDAPPVPVTDAPAERGDAPETGGRGEATEPMVPTGRTTATNKQVAVPLRTLRQHSVVFAGSGSGKTVLLRRLIEECALHGVSSIVLDPNNDLARLGDPWPSPPGGWNPGDAARAEEYHANTDVVVWTPRRQAGRPLVLRPLPAFADVLDDQEEFEQVVEAAVAGLVPRVRLTAGKLDIGTAVLKQALAVYARGGGSALAGFVDLLSDLPDGVSDFRGAAKLAADMGERLKAATINDPLFGGEGTPLDPGTLLTPVPGKRARVSVISFVGLPTDAQRQTFVNQLQMALFSWIKKNPAGDRPLGGLLVMDEAQDFAPSGAATACTESTLKLSAQARKYGLGLMFATQAPRGLHNRIPGNAATQFFGRLNSGVQINAAAELARRKGGEVDDIARLTSGLFYTASDGMRFYKVRMPMCLSHHPSSALTEEEVVRRARAGSE